MCPTSKKHFYVANAVQIVKPETTERDWNVVLLLAFLPQWIGFCDVIRENELFGLKWNVQF